MLQKCAILGLVLLLVGGLTIAWVYNETRTEQARVPADGVKYSLGPEEYLDKYGRWYRLSPEQQNQLVLELDKDRQSKSPDQLAREQKARLRDDLDMLAARQMDPGDIADILYGAGWEDEVERYKKLREQTEIAQIIATVCLSIGGVLFALCMVAWMLRLFVHAVQALRHRSCRQIEKPEPRTAELLDIEPHDPVVDLSAPEPRPRQGRRRLVRSENAARLVPGDSLRHGTPTEDEPLSPLVAARSRMSPSLASAEAAVEDGGVALLLTDEPSAEMEWSPQAQWSLQNAPAWEAPQEQPVMSSSKATVTVPRAEQASAVEETLKEQAEDLQKQIAEFKQVAQTVQQASREQSAPLSNTLKDLAEQVSAIREYAACQQDRVEKLQDGYDWGIIRTFCLRVIRCIDNIENRIDNPPEDCADLIYLEEVRDELLFALESSGVEQFRPEINSEYRGQEKLAEAIKDKQPADKPDQAGRIARVLRPGYRYMIDEDNCKVVRTAQVKLFG